jgi:hypothetical protein
MSVIIQNTDFEDQEYMFANVFGIIDDLTLKTYLRLVPPQVRTSESYDLSDVESSQLQIPPAPDHLLDMGYISPNPDDVRECTQ